ncbi:hypothetical protein DFJ74DRAFT_688652 [Hyaloraphidium curvatum]|nr:hypothetical protein DFJ74DRAFT_698246 [Hyaloraphidium curvatum]KAI9007666.1 hypothetical protein DFJ74DRAFT_688652 [Hyaloraphidium curvatum]
MAAARRGRAAGRRRVRRAAAAAGLRRDRPRRQPAPRGAHRPAAAARWPVAAQAEPVAHRRVGPAAAPGRAHAGAGGAGPLRHRPVGLAAAHAQVAEDLPHSADRLQPRRCRMGRGYPARVRARSAALRRRPLSVQRAAPGLPTRAAALGRRAEALDGSRVGHDRGAVRAPGGLVAGAAARPGFVRPGKVPRRPLRIGQDVLRRAPSAGRQGGVHGRSNHLPVRRTLRVRR